MATNFEFTIQSHSPVARSPLDRAALLRQVRELGEWFQNLNLFGVETAPNHFLGDYPRMKWEKIRDCFPEDLAGASILDVGCNAGYYCIALKERGAGRVLGVDVDDRYLAQARFAAATLGLEIEFEKRSVYEVDSIKGKFDYVLFMGIFYHLRYPLLALDQAVKKVEKQLVFQTMLRGSERACAPQSNYDFWNQEVFDDPDFPRVYFIENSYSSDQTNWFIPNRSGAEGMLRSAGLEILMRPEPETWICAPANAQRNGRYILDMELDGTL